LIKTETSQTIMNIFIIFGCTSLTGVWWPKVKWVKVFGKLSTGLLKVLPKIKCDKFFGKLSTDLLKFDNVLNIMFSISSGILVNSLLYFSGIVKVLVSLL
jgi:hypothetical protein